MTKITRRDFLNGIAWLGAGSVLPWPALVSAAEGAPYPPALTGLRGSHPGSFEAAHALAWGGGADYGAPQGAIEEYDLIVVGAGISGLSAALYYRQQIKADARILVLDNHDDFGGHARRNEFEVDGRRLIAYGGTQSLDTPSAFSAVSRQLLTFLGIDLKRLENAYDQGFFQRHGLTSGVFYDQPTFGQAKLLKSAFPTTHPAAYSARYYVPGLEVAADFLATLDQTPLSAAQKAKLREVFAVPDKAGRFFQGGGGKTRFSTLNYPRYLKELYQIDDPALIALLSMSLAEDSALGGASVLLADALEGGLPGLPPQEFFSALFDDEDDEDDEDDVGEKDAYLYHFPDGNATLSRLLVQQLVPGVAQFETPEQCLSAKFDYRALDREAQAVRIRLNSLAVSVENAGHGTRVRYLHNGTLREARAGHTVMAGWHMMAAHIIKDLPAAQKQAMRANIKMPLVYAQVALRQWRPLQKAGVGAAYCPGSRFQFVQMDFPVAMGAYRAAGTPDQPVVLLMIRMPCPMLGEGSPAELFRQGRAELLGTSFADFESQIREQLQAMYGNQGFDGERDIAAITVNRWPHGFVYERAEYQGQPAHLAASKRFGRILIANADAAGRAYTDAAIDTAWQAIAAIKKKA